MPYADPEKAKVRQQAYRQANREKINTAKREYYAANREKVKGINCAYQAANKIAIRRQRKEHYAANRTALLKQKKDYYSNKKEDLLSAHRIYYRKNKEKILKQNGVREMERYRSDPKFRVQKNLRSRLWLALKGNTKAANTAQLLGCSISDLREHLEKQFVLGMTWENYGPVWHVDHIKPCAKFDLTDPEQQKECFHFSNLQPLFAQENLKKCARYAP